jgi:hypothetical protein
MTFVVYTLKGIRCHRVQKLLTGFGSQIEPLDTLEMLVLPN